MSGKRVEIIGSLVGLVLFTIALLVLRHALRGHHYHDIMLQLRSIPSPRIAAALLFTLLSYFALTLYDMLALRYIKHPIAYPKVAFTSFVTYSMSHNLGFSLFTGGSIRLRLYSAWGLSTLEISYLMTFGVITFWLGYLTSGAATFLLRPLAIPPQITLPFESTFPIGLVFLTILGFYFVWVLYIKRPVNIRGWKFEIPSSWITGSQVGVGVFDWLMASMALYLLLPADAGFTYDRVLGIYLLSQIAGLASNVPGGLGVFETVFILLAGSQAPADALVGSLLAYRLVYYLIPLFTAAISLAVYEFIRRKEEIRQLAVGVTRWVPGFMPYVLSVTVFLSGVILLISGSTPPVPIRMVWLERILPLPVIEISHFFGSILGLWLLILARGLQRRIDAAYHLSLLLLASGIVASLLKGVDYEEAGILAVMMLALLPSKSYFYRKSSLLTKSLSPTWIAAILVAVVATVWLAVFSFKHVLYRHELWWQFSFAGDAPRSIRAAAGGTGGRIGGGTFSITAPRDSPAEASQERGPRQNSANCVLVWEYRGPSGVIGRQGAVIQPEWQGLLNVWDYGAKLGGSGGPGRAEGRMERIDLAIP